MGEVQIQPIRAAKTGSPVRHPHTLRGHNQCGVRSVRVGGAVVLWWYPSIRLMTATPLILSSILLRGRNNLDLIRLIAALAVIFGHAFALHPNAGSEEPIGRWLGFTSVGNLAVDVFFFLSGILVTGSFCQSKTYTKFILMRVARIWPGLIVCLLFTTLAVGPVVTVLPVSDYFRDWHTRWYLLQNLLLKIVYQLPGVFVDNHYKTAVNGSLWTLPIEVRCYAMVFIVGALHCLRNEFRALMAALMLAAILLFWPGYFSFMAVGEGFRLPFIFLAGMVCYAYGNRLPIDWRLSALALIFLQIFPSESGGKVFFYIFLMNTVLVLAAWPSLRRFQPAGDYSYGVYIYGFVIQQVVANSFPLLSSYPSLLISIPVTLAISIASWKYVEEPSLRYGRAFADAYRLFRVLPQSNLAVVRDRDKQ